jgi:hypothetical protein
MNKKKSQIIICGFQKIVKEIMVGHTDKSNGKRLWRKEERR